MLPLQLLYDTDGYVGTAVRLKCLVTKLYPTLLQPQAL